MSFTHAESARFDQTSVSFGVSTWRRADLSVIIPWQSPSTLSLFNHDLPRQNVLEHELL